jgi:hypothetical protein
MPGPTPARRGERRRSIRVTIASWLGFHRPAGPPLPPPEHPGPPVDARVLPEGRPEDDPDSMLEALMA